MSLASDTGVDARTAFDSLLQKSRPKSRPALGAQSSTPVGLARDALASHYTSLADDATVASKKREAAMLYSAAEEALGEEDVESCLKSAGEALDIFREVGDAIGIADTLVVVIRAHRFNSDIDNLDPDEALRVADSELQIARTAGDKRAEACMLMMHAEVKTYMRGRTNLTKALDHALEAKDLFVSLKDKKMEGTAQLALMNIYFLKGKCKECLEAAKEASKIFKALGDTVGEAKAEHGHALSYVIKADYESMLKHAKKALDIYRTVGNKRSEAFQLSCLAQIHLLNDKPQKALPLAHEGLAITRDVSHAQKATEAFMLLLVCEALAGINRQQPALKEAKKGLRRFQDEGDQRGVVMGLEVVLYAHYELEAYDEAVTTAEEALDVLHEFGDKRMELNMQFLISVMHMRREEPKQAMEALKSALDLAQELDDQEEEANVQRGIADVHLSEGSTREALSAANEARTLYESIEDPLGEASALIMTSFANIGEDNEKALSAATEASEIYAEQEDIDGESMAQSLICQLLMQSQRFDEALEAAQRKHDLWEDIGNKKEMAYALNFISQAHVASDNPEEALRAATEGKALAETVGEKRLDVAFCLELVQVYVMLMDRETGSTPAFTDSSVKALKFATEAVSTATKHLTKKEDKGLRARALLWRAQVLFYCNNGNEALRVATSAEKLFKDAKRDGGASEALTLQAYVHESTQQQEKAMEMAGTALELARGSGDQRAEEAALAFFDMVERKEQERKAAEMAAQQAFFAQGAAFQAVAAGPTDVADAGPVSVAAPKGLDPVMTKNKLMRMVKDVIASDDDLETDSPFMEAGMDSLSSVQLMTEVSKEFQLSLSPSLIFDFPTVRAMVDHLVEESKAAAELAY